MQPDGARAYVACTPDDNVAVIGVSKLEVIGRIEAGRQPAASAGSCAADLLDDLGDEVSHLRARLQLHPVRNLRGDVQCVTGAKLHLCPALDGRTAHLTWLGGLGID